MDPRLAAAEQVYRQDGAEAALPQFERLLQVFTESMDARNAALAEGYIGECHWRLGNFDEARAALDHALAQKRELGDRLQQGKTLNVLGLLEWDLGNFDEAIERFGEASGIGKELGDRKLEGATLNNLSLVYDELGDYRTSLAQYQQVLEIYKGIDFPRGEGDTLGNIGGVYLLLGHYRKAVDYYQQALKISEQLKSVPAMSQDHGNLGLSYLGLGQTERALQHFDQALHLAEQAGMRQEQGLWLRGKGNAYIKAGRYDLGLQNHRAALKVYAEVEAQPLLLEALHDMGQLYLELGDPVSAQDKFQQAIDLAREIGSSRGISNNLLALGDLQYGHRRFEEAAALYAQALERARESGELGIRGEALLRLASVHLEQGQFEQASGKADEALRTVRDTGARPTEAAALHMLAEVDREQGRLRPALDRYQQAETVSAKLGDPDLLWRIEYGRALALEQAGRKQAAVGALQKAVGYIESVRNQLQEKRFRAGYIQDKHQVYIELVRLQLELGRNDAAFSTSERLRAWSYDTPSARPEAAHWTESQRLAETEMRERITHLQDLLQQENSKVQPDRRQLAIDTFSQELISAEREYQALLDDVGSQGAVAHKANAPVDQQRVRQRLEPGEALIEYVVGADDLMTFVLTAGSLHATSRPLQRRDLYARLELLRDLLQQRDGSHWQKPAAQLAKDLLEPLREAGWLDGVQQVFVVPHGMLHYLPFALLPVATMAGQQPAIELYSLAYLPSAATLARDSSASSGSASLLAVAPANSHLPYAQAEARSIAAMFQPHAELLDGASATEGNFKEIAAHHRVLHLATHGYFNRFNPLLSGLELEPDEANDGLLEVYEILGLKLDADLVTLSACETGLGAGYFSAVPAGDEFVSLTRAFLRAGSQSVLATLWAVDDRSTVKLMTDFYRRLEEPGTTRDMAVALANAQRQLRASGNHAHPYYWAPFVLVGSTHPGHPAGG